MLVLHFLDPIKTHKLNFPSKRINILDTMEIAKWHQ